MNQLMDASWGIFFEKVNMSERIDLVTKLPSDIIDSILSGASCYLANGGFFISRKLFVCATFAVEDDPPSMFYLSRIRELADKNILSLFFGQREFQLHIFNESNQNIVSFAASISVPKSDIKGLHDIEMKAEEVSQQQNEEAQNYLENIFSNNPSSLRSIKLNLENPEIHRFYNLG